MEQHNISSSASLEKTESPGKLKTGEHRPQEPPALHMHRTQATRTASTARAQIAALLKAVLPEDGKLGLI